MELDITANVEKMASADIRNELEASGISTLGTRTVIKQRLVELRRLQGTANQSISHSPVIAATFSTSKRPTTPNVSINSAMNSAQRQTVEDTKSIEEDFREFKTLVKNQLEQAQKQEEQMSKSVSNQLEKLNKQMMLLFGAQANNNQPMESFEEFSDSIKSKQESTDIMKLYRQMRMFGVSIEGLFSEIETIEKAKDQVIEMECALQRLNNLELKYTNIVQEIVSLLTDEQNVDREINSWTRFQREISNVTTRAKGYVQAHREKKLNERKCKGSAVEEQNTISHIRLPKFTLPEFDGDILKWISWWDEFKTCIHENKALGDREKFNYLRMYVKGPARRAIEFIEVSSDNYHRAVEALTKRYGRKRIVVEHLIESILSIEKKDKISAPSLRYLYDVLVSRYHTLEYYEPNLKLCHRIMLPILQSKLPQKIRRLWEYEVSKSENEEEDKKITAEYFFDFLRSHVMSEEAAESSHQVSQEQKIRPKPFRRTWYPESSISSAMVLTNQSAARQPPDDSKFFSNDCVFCGKMHESSNCYAIRKKSIDERLELCKEKRLCFNCLHPTSTNHSSANCSKPGCLIDGCNKKHHVLLHRTSTIDQQRKQKVSEPKGNQKTLPPKKVSAHSGLQTGVLSASIHNQIRLLPTAIANIHHGDTQLKIRVLVDSGSDQSYIRKDLAETLQLPSNGPAKWMTISMHGGQAKQTRVKNVNFQLSSEVNETRIPFSAWTVKNVCAPLQPVPVDLSCYTHLQGLELADEYPRKSVNVDLLIGVDQWSQVILDGIRKNHVSTPIAVNSIFGWMVSGCIESVTPQSEVPTSSANLAVVQLEGEGESNEDISFNLKKFWELESIGICDKTSQTEPPGYEHFQSSISFDGERYEVSLPWKDDQQILNSNLQQARKRLIKVEERLSTDPERMRMYNDAMKQYLKDGHAKEVTEKRSSKRVYYLPHHPVFREDRETTKCRVVFDASAKNRDGISLNDCLYPGPALQRNLVSIILRFRLHKIAMMADIKKMFLQIKIAENDQDVQRFLWRESTREEPKPYCMTRVTFGLVSSPFQAIATVRHHASVSCEDFPRASKETLDNIYVDDYLGGEKSVEEALSLHQELYSMMKAGGFKLVKWYTNSKELSSHIDSELLGPRRSVEIGSEIEPLKALGLSWDTEEDVFLFNQGEKLIQAPDKGTKRSLTSIASKLFDPLGFLAPYTIRAKILFREVWLRGTKWDDALEDDIKSEWQSWKSELKDLKFLKVPRCYYLEVSHIAGAQLHGFSDASLKAYGAVVYLRLEDSENNVETHLVMAKNKVAPTKRVSLPRLELLAAFMLSKLVRFVVESLTFPLREITCWTDSTIVLSWIRQPSHKWKTFVANRVQSIQEYVPPENWRFCPGTSNPADLLTRGESLKGLSDEQSWWEGPKWLVKPMNEWPAPSDADRQSNDKVNQEVRKSVAATTLSSMLETEEQNDEEKFDLITRISSWRRLIRVTAWILRWSRLRNQPKSETLTSEELQTAEYVLIGMEQRKTFIEEYEELRQNSQVSTRSSITKLSPMIDTDKNLLVVGGRLQFAMIPEEAKHQIIIPHKNALTEKLILHVHATAQHAGPETTLAVLRQKYWPTQGRREVKRVLRKCLVCKHWSTKTCEQKMAPLPTERVQITPAFTNIGIDFTGPLYIKQQGKRERKKAYICIFVCEDSRAVHFELTNDMTTEEFLQAFRRMANRRGTPSIIRSDNQTTFHKSQKVFSAPRQRLKLSGIDPTKVQEQMADKQIHWKFNTERASHRGGHWERVCRQLKEPLKKVLGKAFLTYTEMYTVLTDIEAIINSRPLSYIGDDIRDGRIITPALLAINRDLQKIPDDIPVTAQVSLNERYRYQARIQNHFWKRWQREYLPQLTVRQKWTHEHVPLKKGDVVLVSDDNTRRGQWKLAKVNETFAGVDGLVRTVKLKTAKGLITRPVQRLHLLEEFKPTEQCSSITSTSKTYRKHPRVTHRPTLAIQPPNRISEVNDNPSLRGEDVQIRSRYGRMIKRLNKLDL